ncbi:phage late control D family protein [[Enterobacter] lignolyticus]|uniref:Phage late control D family protein n=1 Tax=[Enterobacter] lignolyticus TaxID=1334193 RepID=A0A806X6V8_9ENTR|nr:phage late control D family protein [[Enterobacter] lignolyticus]ALR77770.1 hypothetical protein AO703_16215 [[Enterobacter] lignolyticus]
MLDALTNGLAGTMTPDFMLLVDERDVTHNFGPRLISLTMTDNRGYEADTVTIRLNDADGLIELPRRGTVIRLYLGYKGFALIGKGSFTVDQITHAGAPDYVEIIAKSANFRGAMNTAREQSWHDTTLGDIAEAIASRNNLTANVFPALAATAIGHIDQSQESDISFITRVAHIYGGEVSVKKDVLLIVKAGSARMGGSQALEPALIHRSDGHTHSFTIADRDAYTGVIATWEDTADPKKQQRKIHLQRKSSADYTSGDKDNIFLIAKKCGSKEEAIYAAKAEWDRLQREAASFKITLAQARVMLSPDTPVSVRGFKRIIDDHAWNITQLTHSLTSSGFTTSVELELQASDVEYEIVED